MRNRLIIIYLAICSFFLFARPAYSVNWTPADSIVIRGGYNSPPFEFLNAKGEPDGFSIDIIKAIFKDLEWENYKIILDEYGNTYNRIIAPQKKNPENVIFLGVIYTPEKSKEVRFSLPITMINMALATKQSTTSEEIHQWINKKIIVVSGAWTTAYLQNKGIARNLNPVKNIQEGLTLLSEGKADVLFGNESIIRHFVKHQKTSNLKVVPLNHIINPIKYTMAVPQGNEDLLYQINLSLQRLKSSGVYDSIYDKWFGVVSPTKTGKIVSIIFLSLSFVVLVMFVFLWILRRQIKQATRMLSISKQELEMAFDAGKIGAWSYNIETKIISKLRGEIFEDGKTLDHVLQRVHPEDTHSLKTAFQDLSTRKRIKSYEYFRIKKELNDVAYSVYEIIMLRTEATKNTPAKITGTLKDVTNDVKLKNKLEDYKLKSSFIIETNEILLLEYDLEKQTFINVTHSDEKGITARFSRKEYLQHIHPHDLSIATHFIETMENRKEEKIATEFRFLDAKNVYQWYSLNTVAYRKDENGKITSYLGLRRNNSKWKQITEDLISLRNKAEASNKLKSAFLANMSHEIRTPLNAIVGFSGLLSTCETSDEKEQYHSIIRTNSELLLQLIDDILDLSKIEAGYLELKYKMFNLGEYINNLCSTLAMRKPHRVEFIYNTHDLAVNVYSDKNRIGQIISNFVVNAFKFTSEGKVTLEHKYENEQLTISVSDTGIGISKENLPKIFDRFEKLNDFAQGTGLGLPICKALANAMGGDIYVESENGKGSKFTLELPCNIAPEEPSVECISKDINLNLQFAPIKKEDGKLHLDKKTLLIAEDLDNNYILAYKLLSPDFKILRAHNGVEAVEYALTCELDYILMDMKMPVMDGLEATRRIREFNKTIPIIALTAYVLDTDRIKAHNSGCSAFLSKPLNKEHLLYELNTIHNS